MRCIPRELNLDCLSGLPIGLVGRACRYLGLELCFLSVPLDSVGTGGDYSSPSSGEVKMSGAVSPLIFSYVP